ncbi:hypothetical protein I4U23_024930 [Adineta vaga]|nr:hypothetical protein I4U23_024930 [Adineta vaga]
MSNTANSNNIPSDTSVIKSENELDDLVSQLRQTINQGDWLVQNTSTKWEQENPELAKQWREAMKANQPNETIEQ